MSKLMIVESPHKAQTIKKFLGKDYNVMASCGHIMEIPKKGLGIDVANGFVPQKEVSDDKKDIVKKIKDAAKEAEEIIIATDPDREGEGIAQDIYDLFSKEVQKKCCRITYREITKKAIEKELSSGKRKINKDLADAQKARQVLDRLIGYKISPLLWNDVASKTSAGRVQSVALKIVCEREKEIKVFKSEDFWYLDAKLKCADGEFVARTITDDKDNRFLKISDVESAYKELEKAKYAIESIERKSKEVEAKPPFDTASLQSTASSLFGWDLKKTAKLSQTLYDDGLCFLPGNYITNNNGDIQLLEHVEGVTNMKSINKDFNICNVDAAPFKKEYNGEIIELVLNNTTYKVTPDHIFPVYDSETGNIIDKKASEISILKDYLLFDKSIRRSSDNKSYNILNIFDDSEILLTKNIRIKFSSGYVKTINNIKQYILREYKIFTYYKYLRQDTLPLNIVKDLIKDGIISEIEIKSNYRKIGFASSTSDYIEFPFEIGEDFYYLIGLMMSDGHSVLNEAKFNLQSLLKKNPRKINIFKYVDIENEITNLLLRLGIGKNKIKKNLCYSSRFIKILLNKFGIPDGNKSGIVDINKIILVSNDSCVKAFIAGLWDGDGYFTFNKIEGNNCSIQSGYTSKSRVLIDKMKILLSSFGIFGYLHSDGRNDIASLKISIYDVGKMYELIKNFSLIKSQVYESIINDVKTVNSGYSKCPYNLPLVTIIDEEIISNKINKNILFKQSGHDLWTYCKKGDKFIKDRIPLHIVDKYIEILHSEKLKKYSKFRYEQVKDIKRSEYNGMVYCMQSSNNYFLINNGLWTHNCTYIRSDSFNIADEALDEVRELIKSNSDTKYLPSKAIKYKQKSDAASQEAHECIRPIVVSDRGDDLSGDEQKLYKLIRDRFVACQMSPAIVDTVVYRIKTGTKYKLIAKGQSVKFDGWMRIYKYNNTKEELLPSVTENEQLCFECLNQIKNETQPPPRYKQGSLLDKLKKDGVGRPATYPTIMEGIKNRGYVEEMKGKKGTLSATELGMKVYEYLQGYFHDFIMDIHFTASLEEDLDIIESGKKTFIEVVNGTYTTMMNKVDSIGGSKGGSKGGFGGGEKTGSSCPVCNSGSVIQRNGKFGAFFCCDQYPKCKSIFVKDGEDKFAVKEKGSGFSPSKSEGTGESCPVCKKGHIVEKKGKFGTFFSCDQYPKCKTIFIKTDNGFSVKK